MNGQDTEALAFVTHLLHQHEEIEAEVMRVERAWLGELPTSLVYDKLQRLCSAVEHHFMEETEGGCIDEAVARAPHLSPQAAEIEKEHTLLLDEIREIATRLRVADASTDATEGLRCEFEIFVQKLREHESAENRLVQEGFGVEIE